MCDLRRVTWYFEDIILCRCFESDCLSQRNSDFQGEGTLIVRIAQIAPLLTPVPPKTGYGAVGRIASYLTEGLVELGHDVTLFANAGSLTGATLVPCAEEDEIPWTNLDMNIVYIVLMYEQVFRRANQFDVIHNHTNLYLAPLARRWRTPTVTTVYDSLYPENITPAAKLLPHYPDLPLAALSESQRNADVDLSWQATIPLGLPKDLYTFNPTGGDYLAFLGSTHPVKGLSDAVAIAERSGVPLKVTAFIHQESARDEITALSEHPLVEYVGEVGDREKNDFLGNALAFIFPIQWEEPFGLVMLEALACGTPVIAYNRGSVPEVIVDNLSGRIVDGVDSAAEAVAMIRQIDRQACRLQFEQRFTAQHVANSHVALYEKLVNSCAN